MTKYTYNEFLKGFGHVATTKVLQLAGHEKIEHTQFTLRCSFELEYYCYSKTCSNCSGISCAAIFVKPCK